jgi:hypothetical protein
MDIHPAYHILTMVLQSWVSGTVCLQFLSNGIPVSTFSNSEKISTFPGLRQRTTHGSYHTKTLPECFLHHSNSSFWEEVRFPSQSVHTAQKMLHLDFPQAILKFFGNSVPILKQKNISNFSEVLSPKWNNLCTYYYFQ